MSKLYVYSIYAARSRKENTLGRNKMLDFEGPEVRPKIRGVPTREAGSLRLLQQWSHSLQYLTSEDMVERKLHKKEPTPKSV